MILCFAMVNCKAQNADYRSLNPANPTEVIIMRLTTNADGEVHVIKSYETATENDRHMFYNLTDLEVTRDEEGGYSCSVPDDDGYWLIPYENNNSEHLRQIAVHIDCFCSGNCSGTAVCGCDISVLGGGSFSCYKIGTCTECTMIVTVSYRSITGGAVLVKANNVEFD